MTTWTQETVLAKARGFMEARVILTAAELDVLTMLAEHPQTLDEAIASLGTQRRPTTILLDALAGMKLLSKVDGIYSCPEQTAALLSADSPTTVLPMVRHYAGLWRRWETLSDLLQGKAPEVPVQRSQDPSQIAAFIGAMHAIGRDMAKAIAEAAAAGSCTKLLDIGGATGTYAEAFLAHYPDMHATVFDRPQVIRLAEERLATSPIRHRIALVEGDFYTDELPGEHDLALLSAIIHQNSRAQNVELYKKTWRALVDGGRLLIRDHIMSEDHLEPPDGALFAVNMLVATDGGDCYSLGEIREDLEEAGFRNVALLQSGERMDGLVEAFKT